jgi:hypothetical protein
LPNGSIKTNVSIIPLNTYNADIACVCFASTNIPVMEIFIVIFCAVIMQFSALVHGEYSQIIYLNNFSETKKKKNRRNSRLELIYKFCRGKTAYRGNFS